MSRSFCSLAVLATLSLPVVAAHADTFAGSASFQDNGPAGNSLNYTGSFANPSFSFSGPVGTTYTDLLTITSSRTRFGDATDNISVKLTFTAPSATSDTISGTGDNDYDFFFLGTYQGNDIDWNNNVSLINFTDGSQLTASLPDFSFSDFDSSTAKGSEYLTLKVTKAAVTPEPSSLALLGTGLVGACGVVRRRLAR